MSASASFVKSLLAQCCLGGICEWVVCPGARNMALLQVLAAAEDLVKWTHFDERSAAFFALGRIQDMGLPVAVVTTSGTAAAELLPAVVEAYYQRRPLLLLTADRPADYRGSAAPQAIEQADLFGIYAPTIDLETPDSLPEDILEDWDYASPLHINVCLPDPDPAWNPGNCDLYPAEPPEENDFRGSLAELARALRFKSRDGLVVMLGGLDPTEQAPARWLANELKAPVVADATSGLREELAHLALTDADALLRENPPAILLRIGDVPVARFWRDLEDIPSTEVFSVTRTGFSGLARPSAVVTGDLEAILHALGDVDPVGDVNGLRAMNKRRKALMEELLITCPDSEQAMVRAFSCFAADGDCIYLGNSMPVRYWNSFAQMAVPTENVRANRGANGIDGQISGFLGVSARCSRSWALVGDLTAMYDSNALALLPQLDTGTRVLGVINNGGGGIFRALPGAASHSEAMRNLLVQPHAYSFKAIAEQWGMRYLAIRTAEDFDQLDALEENSQVLAELIPDREQTEQVRNALAKHGTVPPNAPLPPISRMESRNPLRQLKKRSADE